MAASCCSVMPTGAIKNPGQNVEAFEMLCFSSIVAQLVEDIPIELGMTFHVCEVTKFSVHDALFINPLGAGLFDLGDVTVAGQGPGDTGSNQKLYAVADGEDPFALLVEIPN